MTAGEGDPTRGTVAEDDDGPEADACIRVEREGVDETPPEVVRAWPVEGTRWEVVAEPRRL